MSRPIAADFIAQVTNYEGEKLCGVDLHATKSVLHAYSGECKGERDEGEFIICAHEISLSRRGRHLFKTPLCRVHADGCLSARNYLKLRSACSKKLNYRAQSFASWKCMWCN